MLSALQWLQYATASSAQQNPCMPMVQKSDQTQQQPADWDGDHGGLRHSDARHHALTLRFETSALSHSCSFDQRRRPETLRTAMATAFF
jgi:hypothetical protein